MQPAGAGKVRTAFQLAAAIVGVAAVAAQVPDRRSPPDPGPAPALSLPAIETGEVNGIPIRIVEMHEVPVVQVAVIADAGAALDPAGKEGRASMMGAMLDEGAAGRDAVQLADALDLLGATLSVSTTYDATSVRLGVPVERMTEALALMADVVMRPAFPERELERLKRERLTSLLQARDDPGSIASLAFPRLVFGTGHRYALPEIGTAESVASLSVADVREAYRYTFRPAGVSLVVAGDISREDALARLETAFGEWRPATDLVPPPARLPAVEPHQRRVYLIDVPGAPQSEIRIGGVGVARTTPDYFPVLVMNTILGGSFTSRLNTNLRETHGYTYGAFSGFSMRRAPGPFVALAAVQTDKTAEAVAEFFRELSAIREPVPPEEFGKAQRYVALGFPTEFETTGDMVAKVAELIVYGLPPGTYDAYVRRVSSVSPDEVAAAARSHVRPGESVVLVVGDRTRIEAPLRGLDLGPLTVLGLDDVLGPAPNLAG